MKKGYKECPFCGEKIKEKAIKCLHCGEYLDKKEIVEEKDLKKNDDSLENANIFTRFIVQLFTSIINIVLRILGFISSPFSIPYTPNELDFIYGKYFDKEPKYKHYLLFIYIILSFTIGIGGISIIVSGIIDENWELAGFGLAIFYGIHGLGYLICLLLCKYKYDDEYKEYVKNYDKNN